MPLSACTIRCNLLNRNVKGSRRVPFGTYPHGGDTRVGLPSTFSGSDSFHGMTHDVQFLEQIFTHLPRFHPNTCPHLHVSFGESPCTVPHEFVSLIFLIANAACRTACTPCFFRKGVIFR